MIIAIKNPKYTDCEINVDHEEDVVILQIDDRKLRLPQTAARAMAHTLMHHASNPKPRRLLDVDLEDE